jgi:hypothetical protein
MGFAHHIYKIADWKARFHAVYPGLGYVVPWQLLEHLLSKPFTNSKAAYNAFNEPFHILTGEQEESSNQ